MQVTILFFRIIFVLVLSSLFVPNVIIAKEESCFSNVKYAKPKEPRANRGLYIFIDETVPLTDTMKKKVASLVKGWGNPGDLIKIARFSASYRNLYPELVFSEKVESPPDESFMYQLHYRDKVYVKNCLKENEVAFRDRFFKKLTSALKKINPKIPKSELLESLRLLSKQLVVPDESVEKTVLIISDGLENSSVASFYQNGGIKRIKPRKLIAKLRRQGMMGFWKNTKIYMYGLGLMPDKKRYAKPSTVNGLKRFWERYFVEGGGKVKEIGAPELLLTAIE